MSQAATMPAPPAARLPRHLAVIMDGNGRWAQRRNRPRTLGHRAGAKAVQVCVDYCLARGIEALTLFAFSSENWRRPRTEVSRLMELFVSTLGTEASKLHANGVRIRFIGDRAAFSAKLQREMEKAAALTAANTRLDLNVAVNYGGRWEIVHAARALARRVAAGELAVDAIDEPALTAHLADMPEPDLFIRTGGDQRLSNFLLWHLAYTELYFTETLWPDFGNDEFDAALADYAARERLSLIHI